MMAEYNPLHSAEINSGLNVYSYHLKDNFNAIKTATDTKLNKDSATTQNVAGIVIFNQLEVTTFSGNPNFTGTPILTNLGLGVTSLTPVADLNAIATAGHVVANDATANKPTATGVYTVTTLAGNNTTSSTQTAVNTAVAGDVWVRQETAGTWGAWRQLSDRQYALGDSIRGAVPTYTSTTSITMGAGLVCADSLRTTIINVPNATVVNFATTGLNGLDTGTIASNTWYYIHAILNPTTGATGYLASTSSTSPTMPSGFTIRRLLQYQIKTASGGATIQPFRFYDDGQSLRCEWTTSRADEIIFNTLGIGSSTPYVVDASSSVPPICNGLNAKLIANVWQDTTTQSTWSRLSTDAGTANNWIVLSAQSWVAQSEFEIDLYDATRQFRLRNDASGGGAAACNCIVTTLGYIFYYKGVI